MTAIFIPAATVSHTGIAPYISLAEYIHAPTAVDTTSLVTSGSDTDQKVELGNVIRRATGWANSLCYQILAATLDVQTASDVYVRRDGTVRVSNAFWPFRELDSFTAGPTPGMSSPVTASADIVLIGRKVLVVPVSGLMRQYASGTNMGVYGPIGPGSRVTCQWSYWNGWFHSTLAASVAAAATSLTLTTKLPQAAAGASLTIVDGPFTEVVTVSSTFTGGTTLPLAAPLVYAHIPGTWPESITVTELPDDARQATISLTSALIKTKGTEAYVLPSVAGTEPSSVSMMQGGGFEDLSIAVDLLAKYARVA